MAAAPKTVYTYDLDGANRDFQIPFEYLTRKFIQVTLIGQDRQLLILNIDYRFTQRTVITTTKAWGPADGYERIELRRYTSATERLVDFNDGSILKAYDLNTSQVQSLHIAEEGRDVATDTIGTDNDGNLDARGRRIVNLADATEDGHAVTLRQEREWAASTLGNRNAAEASAQATAKDKVDTNNLKLDAQRYAGESAGSASAAKASAKVATDEIAKIDGQVEVAKGHADRAGVNAQATAKDKEATNNLKLDAQRYAGEAGTSASAAAVSANSLAPAYGSISGRVSTLEGRMKALGDGQEWTDMTSQRTWGTTYTNDTGRSIQVIVRLTQVSVSLTLFYVNDFLIGYFGQATVAGGGQCSAIVPPGSTYRLIAANGRNSLEAWYELR